MNDLEKRSFYSFLGLYIISSFLFISIIGYWYYIAQKRALEEETRYRMEHVADKVSGEIIYAHMQGRKRAPLDLPKGITLALVDTEGRVVEGKIAGEIPHVAGYFHRKGQEMLVSDAPRRHLGINFVVVQTDTLAKKIVSLRHTVLGVMGIVALLIVIIAWMLSRLFMRPVHERVAQIERFINDITHELNTPISSLNMATDQALKRGECTAKTLKNISISTRQLFDIYRSLTYLNFSKKERSDEVIALDEVLQKSIGYYTPLAQTKEIDLVTRIEPATCILPESEATLLFGNLISNAIKYSPRRSQIEISLEGGVLVIKDHGIGIDPSKQKEIFGKFNRATTYSGGFGVGLSIVKRICDRYGIRITLDSVPDKGTEFRLYFPVK